MSLPCPKCGADADERLRVCHTCRISIGRSGRQCGCGYEDHVTPDPDYFSRPARPEVGSDEE